MTELRFRAAEIRLPGRIRKTKCTEKKNFKAVNVARYSEILLSSTKLALFEDLHRKQMITFFVVYLTNKNRETSCLKNL